MAEGLPAPLVSADPFAAFGPLEARVNVARFLPEMAAARPDAPAVQVARRRHGATRLASTSFAELEARSNRIAAALRARGLRPGDRACVFVRAGVELVAIGFALWKLGAVPVLMDPGMGRTRLASCIARTRPRAFLGVPRAHALRLLHRDALREVELFLAADAGGRWPGADLDRLALRASDAPLCHDTGADDVAAVLFTSGATGPPKGVVYTHGNFRAQIHALKTLYGFAPGEVDLACFPLFALFSPALGMTCAFPELDPSKPGSCDPRLVVEALEAAQATTTFGSPAIWRRVAPWCRREGRRLPGLARVLIAGAPVPVSLFEEMLALLDADADVHSPYGATEALPVASTSGRELLRTARARIAGGAGTCVGAPAPGIAVRLIPIRDEPLASFEDVAQVPDGQPGEVCVSGPVVTRAYLFDERATALAKIRDGERVWHRMGDLAWRALDGRLWFCGRKAHRIETAEGLVLPVPVENVLNEREEVARCALVGVGARGRQRPVLVVEPREGALAPGEDARAALCRELLAAAGRNPRSAVVAGVLLHPSLPVDVRHNAKIDREALARWAAERLA